MKRVLLSLVGIMGLGCGSGLGEVTVQESSSAHPHLPTITAERLQQCFSIYGGQLQPGRHYFNPVVEVNRDGMSRRVETPDMPDTAPDFAACTRIALSDMSIPDGILSLRRTQATATNEVTPEQRSYMGNPAVAVVVVVGLSEIVLEAGAYTVLFGVTVKVLEKAAEDVEEEGWKAACIAKYAACIAAVGTFKRGNHLGISRCASCLEACKEEQSWPSDIGNGSCEFWKRNWK